MKFGFREKIIAASAVLVLIVIGWYMLYYSPKKSDIATMRADIQKIQTDIGRLNVTDAMLDSLSNEIVTLQESARNSVRLSVPEDSILYVAYVLEQHIRGSNLKITQDIQTNVVKLFPDINAPVDTSTLESKTGIRPIDIDLSLQGSFENLVQFLEGFANFPFLIRAGKIMISTDDLLYPELRIDLTVYFFLEIN